MVLVPRFNDVKTKRPRTWFARALVREAGRDYWIRRVTVAMPSPLGPLAWMAVTVMTRVPPVGPRQDTGTWLLVVETVGVLASAPKLQS
jgi:hypothetical protein